MLAALASPLHHPHHHEPYCDCDLRHPARRDLPSAQAAGGRPVPRARARRASSVAAAYHALQDMAGYGAQQQKRHARQPMNANSDSDYTVHTGLYQQHWNFRPQHTPNLNPLLPLSFPFLRTQKGHTAIDDYHTYSSPDSGLCTGDPQPSCRCHKIEQKQ